MENGGGAGLKTAAVALTMSNLREYSDIGVKPVQVDDQGKFTLRALPRGRDYKLTVSAPGFASRQILVGQDQWETATLQLPPVRLQAADQKLEGVVLWLGGNPAPSGFVTAVAEDPNLLPVTTRTDPAGHFALDAHQQKVALLTKDFP